MYLQEILEKFRKQFKSKRRNQQRLTRSHRQLTLEPLEDRTLPTVVFNPALGAETIFWVPGNTAGHPANQVVTSPITSNPTVLNNPTVDFIFWGSSWTKANAGALANDARTIIQSKFFSLLTDYGSDGLVTYGGYTIDNSVAPLADIGPATTEVQEILPTTAWATPKSLSALDSPIYVVVFDTSSGHTPAFTGWNGHPNYSKTQVMNLIWIADSGNNQDTFTDLLSHEVAERISDGTSTGINMNAAENAGTDGEWQNAQISDNEPDGTYYYRLNGSLRVQPYWSLTYNAFVVADGNTQTLYLNPNWNTKPSPPKFLGTSNLTINFDGTLTLNENGSGLFITVHGKNFSFDPGKIASITVNEGGGSHTVNVEGTVSGDPVTINQGGGTDVVNISPSAENLDNIQGTVTVNGGLGTDTLDVDDQNNGNDATWTMNAGDVTRSGAATIFFGGPFINYVNVNGGSGNVEYDVNHTANFTSTTINADFFNLDARVYVEHTTGALTANLGNGFETVRVTDSSKNLDNILGTVTINGLGGSQAQFNTLTINDQNNGNSSKWSIEGDSVTRKDGINTAVINYSNIGDLELFGGSGGSAFHVTPSGQNLSVLPATFDITGGKSTDSLTLNDQANTYLSGWNITGSNVTRTSTFFFHLEFYIFTGSVNYSSIGTVTINSGSGGSQFNLSPAAMDLDELPLINLNGAGSDTAVLNDQNNPFFSDWTVTGSSVTRTYDLISPAPIGIIITPVTATVNYTGLGSLVLNGDSGGNDFELSPSANNLDELPGSVTVNGGGPSNTLNVYDQSNTNNSTWNIGSSSLNRTWFLTIFGISIPIPRTINYTSLTSLGLHGGGIVNNTAANTYTITGTPATTSLDTGLGTDQVNVQAAANPLSINGDWGTDTVTLGSNAPPLSGTLSSIAGPVSVSNHSTHDGSLLTGQTTLIVDDSGDSTGRTATLTSSRLTGLGPAINYTTGEVTSLQIHGGSGGNTFNVLSTGAGTSTSIDAGKGLLTTNTVTIGSLAPSIGGTLANIAGPISVSNTLGSTALIVDDSGDSLGKTATVTNSSITGLAPAAINYADTASGVISSVTIYGGSGSNTFSVQSTALGTPVSLNVGSGSADIVNVGNGLHGVQDIQGALAIEGPAVTLTVDDSANNTPRNATLDTFIPSGETLPFGRITGLAPGVITYELADTASPITIKGGSGGNTFTILSTGTQTLNLSSGTGSDIVNVQAISGPLNLNGQSGSDTVTLGSLAPAIGGVLANLKAAISISNPAGATALTLDDSGDLNTVTATITSSSTTGMSPFAISYANLSSLTVDGGSGKNNYNVQSTAAGTAVTVNAGSGNPDKVNVGSGGGSSTLNNILGALTVNSQTSLTNLTINDQGGVSPTYTVTATTLSRSGAATITYDPVVSLVINAGAGGNNTLTIVSTAFGTPVTFKAVGTNNTVIGPNFPSTFNITSTNGGTAGNVTFSSVQNLTGGSANDTFKFSNGKGVSGTINGGGGTNTLDYSLYTTGVNVNLPGGTATGTGGVSNIQNVVGSSKNDTIVGIAGSVISGNGGVDTLNGGPNDTFIMAATQLAGTTVTGSGGGNTLVGANITNTWIINGAGSGTLNGGIALSGIANLTGGSGIDKFQFLVGGSVAGTIDGGGGANTLDYSGFGGPITVNLQTGAATGAGAFLHIGTLIGAGMPADTLVGANASNTWTLTGIGAGTVGSFHFSAIANLTGGTAADTFKFMSGGGVTGTIDGGGGTDTLDYSLVTAPITVNLQTGAASFTGGFSNINNLIGGGATVNTLIGTNANSIWTISGAAAGNVNGAFTFSDIDALVGGTGVNVFAFTAAASKVTSINGGSATGNWLDYSSYTAAVSANLLTNKATGVSGTISNIQNVHGGNFGNTLTGDAQGNILIGGSGTNTIKGGGGQSILIADAGKSAITGGSGGAATGGDIMIGGTTVFDTMTSAHEAALQSILAEWQSGDLASDRFLNILNGTGGGSHLNGSNFLNWGTTVFDNGQANTLTAQTGAGEGVDWFFALEGVGHTNVVGRDIGDHTNNT